MEKVVILIDGDNTLFGFDLEVERQLKLLHPKIKIRSRKHFYFIHDYPLVEQELIVPIYCQKGFFENLKPFPGAMEAIYRLLEEDYEIYICTQPLTINKYCLSEKEACYARHFGESIKKRIIITPDKSLVWGHVLIDDRPMPNVNYRPFWNYIIFDQLYNQYIRGVPRIYGWEGDEWFETIQEVVQYNKFNAGKF